MKKALLIVACILISITCFCQEIDLNKQVQIHPSNKLVRLSQDEALSFETQKFHDSKHVRLKAMGKLPTFKIDDILITLNSEKGVLEADHLMALKKGLDAMSVRDASHHSAIETVNDQKVLVLSGLSDNLKHYQFFCVNKANTTVVTGLIQFKLTDEVEAKAVLDDLLQNIIFKE